MFFSYILRRILFSVALLMALSLVSFVIIQLPPGDYLSTVIRNLEQQGSQVSEAELESMRAYYGLDLPWHRQYLKWIGNFLRGHFGESFHWKKPVRELISERLLLTIVLSSCTIVFTYLVAVPIGIYSATRQYSLADYLFNIVGFAGLAIPNFLLALVLMFVFYKAFGLSPGGLFSPEFVSASWSLPRVLDLAKHLPIPVVVIGTAGTAGLIRVMRASLLDELRKQYVITARAKGLSERRLLFKYPMRIAINPIVSTIGWTLPAIVSGETITAIVLSLPTTGPLLYGALRSQDMYLAGAIVMLLSTLTIVGSFVSDVLLVIVDPRIRYDRGKR